MISIHAHFDGKVIVPDGPVDLPCDQPLLVRIEPVAESQKRIEHSPSQTPSRAEKYAMLRDEIVASGIPLLDDQALRLEIRDRKGLKPAE